MLFPVDNTQRWVYCVFMKNNYDVIRFTAKAEVNAALLVNRDYHTLCVIHDCFGTHHPETLAKMAARGETFPVNPSWPCCKGEEWYRKASEQVPSIL